MRKATFEKAGSGHFYRTLNKRVKMFFQRTSTSPKANNLMLFKLILFLTLYITIYVVIISDLLTPAYIILAVLLFGLSNALIGFNIAHDAVHGALFSSQKLNRIFAYSFEMIGMSSYVWNLKHNVIHHNYPNLQHGDFDIEVGPVMRMSPADERKAYHSYQHLYAPIVYMLFTLTLVFFSDVKIMFFTDRKQIDGNPHPIAQKLVFIVTKAVYLFLMIILPMTLLAYKPSEVLMAFFLMHFTISILMAFVLIPAHIFEQTRFSEKDSHGKIQEEWGMYQMQTTLDYARKSYLFNFLFGGFNINVVHHLFPRICHVHLIPVSEIVKQTAGEFGITYHETSIWGAIQSHFKALKLLGSKDSPYQTNS